jgi:hypothetical protein
MLIIFKFILKNIREKKLRTFLIIFSVTVSTALFLSSMAATDNLERMAIERAKAYVGEAEILIYAGDKSPSHFFYSSPANEFKEQMEFISEAFVANGSYKYKLGRQNLEGDYQKVTFYVTGLNYSKDFYFKSGKYISPVTYFTRTWKKYSTRYFNFIISDTTYFNNYSANQLENYTDGMLALLRLTDKDKNQLRSNKIVYILCSDSAEIKKITGFNTRGIYILAYDQIITTFNCHFHELSHLLINYKIKNIPLYTLPFMQEGFASATGGRGGIARSIILDIGYFLQKSGYVPYNSLISYKDFNSENASVTYPVAALYSLFLMNELGMEPYLDLYKSYSGNFEYISSIKTEEVKLPPMNKFLDFVNKFKTSDEIIPDNQASRKNRIYSGNAGEVYDEKDYYLFRIKENVYLKSQEFFPNYLSRKFKELYPDKNYTGAKYLMKADSREISIYNLFTNNLIASYSTGLTLGNKNVPSKDGYFEFLVKKDIFNEGVESLQISGF